MPDAGPDDGGTGDAQVPGPGCEELSCDPLALCNDVGDEAVCTCQAGLQGDGLACDDVDECADAALHSCGEGATCLNSFRTYLCRCAAGYATTAGGGCEDIDECGGGVQACSPDARCDNAAPGYACTCGPGFVGSGEACADFDECAAGTDTCDAVSERCDNRRGDYACDCAAGFGPDGSGGCDDLCALAACGDNTRCAVIGDAAVCSCADGFIDVAGVCTANTSCTDNCATGAVCSGDAATPTCTCAPGTEGNPDDTGGDGCVAADECGTGSPCGAQGVCLERPDGYACECAAGYRRQGGTCVDIDECADGVDLCDDNATCENNPGGHDCTCSRGFTGDGLSCADVDECALGSDDCLADTGVCSNTFGAFICACAPGYGGDGRDSCVNLDECADAALNRCDDNASCEDLDPAVDPLGYRCTCGDGLVGDGLSCYAPDPCADSRLNTCDDNALCRSDERGDYTCTCPEGFEGDGETCTCPLSGYWAMRQDVTISWPVQEVGGEVLIEGGSQVATIWELHRYSYDGEQITVDKKGCGSDRSPDLYSPFYEEVYGSYIPGEVFDGLDLSRGKAIALAQADAVPGHSYTTPSEAALVGLAMDNPETDTWPASREDEGIEWVDVEADGMPGMMVWQRSATGTTACGKSGPTCNYSYPATAFEAGGLEIARRAGCVSLASRVITHADATLQSCEVITGELFNESTEVRVYGCALVDEDDWAAEITCGADAIRRMAKCTAKQSKFLDEQKQEQTSSATFELMRVGELDADINCPDVREALPAIPRP